MKLLVLLFVLVDGNFTEWTQWSSCDKTCGAGLRLRTRACSNPSPKHGGMPCQGNSTEMEECKDMDCPSKYFCFLIDTEED